MDIIGGCPANFQGGECELLGFCDQVEQEKCDMGHWHAVRREPILRVEQSKAA
jgi:hypothetical protein